MNLRQILLILRLRWWVVVGTLLTAVALALGISLLLPKQYTSETTLVLDVRTDPLVATLVPSFSAPSYIATQTEIIQSERVASRVVKMMGLAQNPKAVEQWREATEGRLPLETFYGAQLQRGLKVARPRQQPADGVVHRLGRQVRGGGRQRLCPGVHGHRGRTEGRSGTRVRQVLR
jgi:uncharacterized protein involved in exopolysaccharide biosynthesis